MTFARATARARAAQRDKGIARSTLRAQAVAGAAVRDKAFGQPSDTRTTFLLEPRLANAGVSKIPKTLTINGNAGTLLTRYLAGNATTTTWAADVTGPTLTAGGGTIAPAPDSPSPWEDGEGSVFIDDSDSGDILTGAVDDNLHTTDEDLVIEGVFWRGTPQTSGGAGMQITLGRDFGTGGWTVRAGKAGGGNQAPVIQFQATKTGAVSPVVRCSHPEGTWVHVVFVYSPALGRSIVFCGGERIDDQAINLITDLDIAPGAPLIFNRYGGAALRGDGYRVAYFAMWKRAAWFSALSDADDVVRARSAALLGMLPTVAAGTSAPVSVLRSQSILSSPPAAFDKFDPDGQRRVYFFGDNMPRVTRRKDTLGALHEGYIPDDQATNIILDSQDMTAADWSATGVTVTAGARAGPTTEMPVDDANDLIGADLADAERSITLVAPGQFAEGTVSVYAKPGQATWLLMEANSGAGGTARTARVWFDVANGVLGGSDAVGGGGPGNVILDAVIDPFAYVDGYHRVSVVFRNVIENPLVNPNAHTVRFKAVGTDLGGGQPLTFTPADTVTPLLTLWGAQQEGGEISGNRSTSVLPTALIPTRGEIKTRAIDNVTYDGNDGNLPAVVEPGPVTRLLEGRLLVEQIAQASALSSIEKSYGSVFSSNGQKMRFRVGTSAFVRWEMRAGVNHVVSTAAPSPIVIDGDLHEVAGTWKLDEKVAIYLDGVRFEDTGPAPTSLPVTINQGFPFILYLARDPQAVPFQGLVKKVEVVDKAVAP